VITILLSELAFLLPGHPFRGAIKPDPDGKARVVQMRDVSPSGEIRWANMVQTRLVGRKKPDWIVPGDILFVARGQRLFAIYVDEAPHRAVPANQFIHIRLRPETEGQILPAFLAWQINQAPAQRYLDSLATGTHLPSVSKSALSKLPITVTQPIEMQKQVVTLEQQIRQETEAYEALIANRQELMSAVAFDILDSDR